MSFWQDIKANKHKTKTTFPSCFDLLQLKECPCKEVAPNLGELIKRIKENYSKKNKLFKI